MKELLVRAIVVSLITCAPAHAEDMASPGRPGDGPKVVPEVGINESARAFWEAASEGNTKLIRKYLADGADPNTMGRRANEKQEYPAIFAAATGGHWDTVLYLLDAGVDVNASFSDATLLIFAVRSKKQEAVSELLKRGADPNIGRAGTALHVAAGHFNKEIVEALMSNGADPNKEDEIDFTPLFHCSFVHEEIKKADCMRTLVKHKAKVNYKNSDGTTPLMFAASVCDIEGVKVLLQLGADPLATDGRGGTAADHVWYVTKNPVESDRYAVADILVAAMTEKEAETGNLEAQAKLSTLYYSGKGVTRDLVKAAEWVRKAADQGHVLSQMRLGILYRDGLGVDRNIDEAIRWLQKSADRGNANAKLEVQGIRNEQAVRVRQNEDEKNTKQRIESLTLFFRQHGVSAIVAVDSLVKNPFPYQGKVVATFAMARRMISQTDALFSQKNDFVLYFNPFIVTGIPAERFVADRQIYVVGRILGLKVPSAAIEGGLPIAHLEYMGDFSGYSQDEIQAALAQARQ